MGRWIWIQFKPFCSHWYRWHFASFAAPVIMQIEFCFLHSHAHMPNVIAWSDAHAAMEEKKDSSLFSLNFCGSAKQNAAVVCNGHWEESEVEAEQSSCQTNLVTARWKLTFYLVQSIVKINNNKLHYIAFGWSGIIVVRDCVIQQFSGTETLYENAPLECFRENLYFCAVVLCAVSMRCVGRDEVGQPIYDIGCFAKGHNTRYSTCLQKIGERMVRSNQWKWTPLLHQRIFWQLKIDSLSHSHLQASG